MTNKSLEIVNRKDDIVMAGILNKNVNQMPGTDFDCECGYNHKVDIGKIIIGSGVLKQVPKIASKYSSKNIFVVSDQNTYEVCAKRVIKDLKDNKMRVDSFSYRCEEHDVVPDEKALGRLLVEIDPNTSLIVAVGSGVINDICRILSYKLNIPYIIVGTAPSMDGYASKGSPFLVDGYKTTHYAVYPYAIIGDTKILKEAPVEMLRAGFGDVLGKMTSLKDWELSKMLTNEHYCEVSAKLMENAMNDCIDNVDGIISRDEEAIQSVMEALVIAGIAMGIYISTRPASALEHYFAHYWDMDYINRGLEHPLHGNSVGVGTYITCLIYDMMSEYLPEGFIPPDTKTVKELLKKMGSDITPVDLGISKELFKRSVMHCIDDRPKYNILTLAREKGLDSEIAKKLTDKFYN